MSKGYSGLFHGTLGSTFINGSSKEESYKDRGIDVPESVKSALSQLKKAGDYIKGTKDSYSMQDVSVMSKETGVEFARVTIDDETILIRGDKGGAVIPDRILERMSKNKGTLDFHSHPHNNDNVPSVDDRNTMNKLEKKTGQKTSKIVTPNGRVTTFDKSGVVEVNTVSNKIDAKHKKALMDLFGGGSND